MKSIPAIKKFMTTAPHTVGSHVTIESAGKIMHENNIRHLPILEAGELIGVITDRDIRLISGLKDVDPSKETVKQALSNDPFFVSPEASLDEVCDEMARHKFGCTLVVDNKKLVGIFTWVDALNAMSELLNTRLNKR